MSSPEPVGHTLYNASHRAFLQAFMARQVLTFEQAKPILANIVSVRDGGRGLENDIALEDFEFYISTINQQIEPYGYEIRSTHSQTSQSRSRNNRIYAFVNSVSDPQTQLATSHSPDEIAYVKRLLDFMFDTRNKQSREVMAAQSMEAINLHRPPRESLAATTNGAVTTMVDGDDDDDDQPQPATQAPAQGAASSITMGQAEALLESLVREGWLQTSSAKFYSLTPRALLELGGWLEDTYNDPNAEEGDWQPIKNCQACREILTVGLRCADEECNCRLHRACANNVFQGKTNPRCPMCNKTWTGNHYVGEKASRNYQPGRNSNAG